jgi:hypothetical protein
MAQMTGGDLMIQLGVEQIGEGDLIAQMNEAIAEAHRTLQRRRESGYPSGKIKIGAEIAVEYDPNMPDHVAVRYSVSSRSPKEERVTLAKEKNGVLLVQPTGSSEDAPEQMRMFDKNGRLVGTMDQRTGEIRPAAEQETVVGKVGAVARR